ncbi:hypothetical protein ACET3Z_001307 [Daucus carota]
MDGRYILKAKPGAVNNTHPNTPLLNLILSPLQIIKDRTHHILYTSCETCSETQAFLTLNPVGSSSFHLENITIYNNSISRTSNLVKTKNCLGTATWGFFDSAY